MPPSTDSARGAVAVVTDSTASLGAELAAEHAVHVVPLQVVVEGTAHVEDLGEGPGEEGATGAAGPGAAGSGVAGDPVSSGHVADALRSSRSVTTSRPNPEALLAVYEELAADGATAIVSVHLSAELSGTVDSAQFAAERASVPVRVVDTRQVGRGTGYAALAAAQARDDGADLDTIVQAAQRRAASTTSLFYVDTLEHLRRGGRVGAVGALLGTALAVKPILRVVEGRVEAVEKVRTASRALARLQDLAVEAAGASGGGAGLLDVAVAHLDSEDRAWQLADALAERLSARLASEVAVLELGAVLGAHTGPGTVAVTLAPRG